jgi:hypothetical protein
MRQAGRSVGRESRGAQFSQACSPFGAGNPQCQLAVRNGRQSPALTKTEPPDQLGSGQPLVGYSKAGAVIRLPWWRRCSSEAQWARSRIGQTSSPGPAATRVADSATQVGTDRHPDALTAPKAGGGGWIAHDGGHAPRGLPISHSWPNGSTILPRRQPCSSSTGEVWVAPAATACAITRSGSSTTSSVRLVVPSISLGLNRFIDEAAAVTQNAASPTLSWATMSSPLPTRCITLAPNAAW